MEKIEDLRRRVVQIEDGLEKVKAELLEAELEFQSLQNGEQISSTWKWPLQADEYERYGRQLIVPTVGIKGQLRLKSSSVLIIGAGGLGCPAAAYVAGAGVGTLGLVDGDIVEVSNLHRQIAHSTNRVGMLKVDSAISYLKELNPMVTYRAHRNHLTSQNSEEIVSQYDLVLDCTDHPTSRYLISDICVLLGKPLISASAFRTDGQLIVLNFPATSQGSPDGGPCYRCVFPKPPPPDSVVSCGEGGILGPVVGTMGVLQALEAVKLIAAGGVDPGVVDKSAGTPSLLIFSGTAPAPFRSVRMRSRRKDCFACSAVATLTLEALRSNSLDYMLFCGFNSPVQLLQPEERVSATDYNRLLQKKAPEHLLLDVREREHFDICSIQGAVNVPIGTFLKQTRMPTGEGEESPKWIPPNLPHDAPIYVVCRVGNDSQVAAKMLKDLGYDRKGDRFIGDIKGGMRSWKEEVDSTLPFT